MKRKTLVSSIMTIVLCLSLIAGTTYALFTSQDEVDIAVTSGKVDVTATVKNLVTYSMNEATAVNGTFANGGTALFTSNDVKVLKLDKVTPGDKVTFTIELTNASTVDIQYRVIWNITGALSEALEINATDLAWTKWATSEETIKKIDVTVELPAEFETQGLADATITFTVEAVQANGTELYGKTIVSDLAGLTAALADTEDKNIVAIATPIEIKDTVALDLNGKTVEGNFVLVDGANLTVEDGVLTNDDPDASAIQVNGGNLTLNDVEITSARHALRIEGDGSVVTINGGTYVAKGSAGKTQHALNVGEDGANCTVVINGGTFIGPKGTASDSGSAVTVKAGSTVTINGGNFSGGKNNTLSSKGTLVVNGGTFDQDPSAYVAEGYKAAKNADGSYTVVKADVVTSQEELSNAFTDGADTITMHPGTYTFPASNLGEGDVLNAEGVVFTGTSSLNVPGVTVNGGTFVNDSGYAVSGTISGTFKNCTFDSSEALRWCYTDAGETIVFENCVFKTDFRGVHFDAMNGDIIFRNCEINGFNAFSGTGTMTFEGCTFGYDESYYNGLNIYTNTVIKDSTFNYKTGKSDFIDMEGTGKTLTITNCVAYQDGEEIDVATKVGGSKLAQNTVVIDGVTQKKAASQTELNNALTGNSNVSLGSGNYTLPSVSNGDVTISGDENTVITVNKPNYSGSDVTFNGVTVKGSGYSTGVQHVNTVTYNGATIVGEMCLYGEKVVFNDCTFELNGQYIWTYGAKEVEFNNCTFNTTGKAILIYNEGAGASKVTVKGCTFNASAGAKAGAIANQNCAAIEIDNFQSSGTGAAHVLITEGNTYSENFSGEWRIKNFVSGNSITVNGSEYTSIAIDGKTMTIDANKNVTVN